LTPTSVEAEVGVVGAGIIGCAVAWALAKEGRRVLLIDRDEPASAGASFGNAGHVATEQVEPLPSTRLLFTFWRELFAFGGPLALPPRRLLTLSPWIARFASAAFRQRSHRHHLEPLVRGAADTLERQLEEIGHPELMRRKGHYAIWFGPKSAAHASLARRQAGELDIATAPAPADLLDAATRGSASGSASAGVWFPNTAHILDPASVARAFVSAASQRGSTFHRALVRHLQPRGDCIDIVTETDVLPVRRAVICAGAWSPALLGPLRVRAPLEAERGYHVELKGHPPLTDAPVVYSDYSVIVTPMAGRLRATSYLEFAGLKAPPDPRKPARLRARLRRLGYQGDAEGPSWMGPRPTLPDYLPGIGRAHGLPHLFYAVGHQHLGLTLSAVTADLVADLVAERQPRLDVAPFDLLRFG
jgi:glycine/D-amino acid oxidase-like deaminating enzyme